MIAIIKTKGFIISTAFHIVVGAKKAPVSIIEIFVVVENRKIGFLTFYLRNVSNLLTLRYETNCAILLAQDYNKKEKR